LNFGFWKKMGWGNKNKNVFFDTKFLYYIIIIITIISLIITISLGYMIYKNIKTSEKETIENNPKYTKLNNKEEDIENEELKIE
jgi:preprotein translocase subunit SecG